MESEPIPTGRYTRRSGRIARRLIVMLHWRDPGGKWIEVPAETRVLSQYGCLVASPARLKLGEEVLLWWPEGQREARSRVVYRALGGTENLAELAFEFLDTDNFWGMDFPPDLAARGR